MENVLWRTADAFAHVFLDILEADVKKILAPQTRVYMGSALKLKPTQTTNADAIPRMKAADVKSENTSFVATANTI